MWFALVYVLVAGVGVWFTDRLLKRSTKGFHFGLDYLRSGLFCSATLLACHTALYLFTGNWLMSPWWAIVIGFGLPIVMRAVV